MGLASAALKRCATTVKIFFLAERAVLVGVGGREFLAAEAGREIAWGSSAPFLAGIEFVEQIGPQALLASARSTDPSLLVSN